MKVQGVENLSLTEVALHKSKPPEPALPPPASLLPMVDESAKNPLTSPAQSENYPKKDESSSVSPTSHKTPTAPIPQLSLQEGSSVRAAPRRSQSVIDDAQVKKNPRELRRHLSLTSVPPTTFEHTAQTLRSGPFSKDLLTSQLLKRAKDPEVEAFLTFDEQDADIAALSGIGALPPDELTLYQLKGMFSVFDDDKDGHLTRSQLIKCLQLIGFQAREKFLDKYLNYRSPAVMAAAEDQVVGAGDQPVKKKKLSTLNNKVSLNTFLRVTVSELPNLHSSLENDLHSVFEVMDSMGTGEISVKELRHLLTETITPSRLSGNEFQDVLEACGLKVPSLRMEKDTILSTDTFINNLLVGKRWRPL